MDETQSNWDKISEIYEEKFMDLNFYDFSYEAFCDYLKHFANILEIGCGPGNITKFLLDKRSDLKILGTDYSPNMVQLAKKNNPQADFDVLNAKHLDVLNSKFDAIVAGFILPYFSEIESQSLFKNFNRLLEENGILYLSFVGGKPKDSKMLTGSTGDQMFFNYHELKQIQRELHKNGIQIIEIFKIPYPKSENESEIHTVFIAKKQNISNLR